MSTGKDMATTLATTSGAFLWMKLTVLVEWVGTWLDHIAIVSGGTIYLLTMNLLYHQNRPD